MSSHNFLSVFSPEGRLHQVENSFNAVKNEGTTTFAIRGKDTVVVCTQKKVESELIVAESVTHIFNITDSIGAIVTGNLEDAKSMITRLRYQAAEYKYNNGYHIPIKTLSQMYSETSQLMSQYVGYRTMCFVITIVGIDEEDGPQVFKIDPSGFCMGYRAITAGAKEQEGINHFEKLHKKKGFETYETEEALRTAISSISTVIGTDFKKNEIEVGYATADKPYFRKLSEEEIEAHLNVIADEV